MTTNKSVVIEWAREPLMTALIVPGTISALMVMEVNLGAILCMFFINDRIVYWFMVSKEIDRLVRLGKVGYGEL